MQQGALRVLVVGATGSIGRLVVEQGVAMGYTMRALVRDTSKARRLPAAVEVAFGDLTQPETLASAVAGIDAVVFTHGSDGSGKSGSESVDYGGVRNVLRALEGRRIQIALMTSIGVTNRNSSYNRSTEAHDWKRRSERLVRASSHRYTIVRPGWFDCNASNEQRLEFLQGDTRHSGTPRDGAVGRAQIARVLLWSLTSEAAWSKTFELVTAKGTEQSDLDPAFAAVKADAASSCDGVLDAANMPFANEPTHVLEEMQHVTAVSGKQIGELK